MVFDANNNPVLEVRDWTRIQTHQLAGNLQEELTEWIVSTLNTAYEAQPLPAK